MNSIGITGGYWDHYYIEAVKDDGWISFADRKPTPDDLPIKFARSGEKSYQLWHSLVDPHTPEQCFWMRDTTPPIPKKEKTQAEKDMEAAAKFGGQNVVALGAFYAGIKYARGEK